MKQEVRFTNNLSILEVKSILKNFMYYSETDDEIAALQIAMDCVEIAAPFEKQLEHVHSRLMDARNRADYKVVNDFCNAIGNADDVPPWEDTEQPF